MAAVTARASRISWQHCQGLQACSCCAVMDLLIGLPAPLIGFGISVAKPFNSTRIR